MCVCNKTFTCGFSLSIHALAITCSIYVCCLKVLYDVNVLNVLNDSACLRIIFLCLRCLIRISCYFLFAMLSVFIEELIGYSSTFTYSYAICTPHNGIRRFNVCVRASLLLFIPNLYNHIHMCLGTHP